MNFFRKFVPVLFLFLLIFGAGLLVQLPPAGASPESVTICPSGNTGVAQGRTSCPFADYVRMAWITQGRAQFIKAYSPVTQEVYDLFCDPNHPIDVSPYVAARCNGGNGAVVWLW